MRTKHLLYTAAIAAMFSACTNDDFMLDTPQNNVANDGRPTVSDVRLNFIGDDAETRLAFGKDGYAWEANDTIGALLMDEVNTVDPTKTWLERYSLVSDIHTSYPFTYSDGVWSCNTKMLEGNYFFAFPWESYNGQRKVMHSLTNQQQNGVKSNVVAESYAKNQFFIGYAQIKAGSEAKDALTDVEMTSLLGAIQLRIVNTGTQTYHINKVVLKGDKLSSVLTFDPKDAAYGTWNLRSSSTFNYANYTGNQEDVYTTGSTTKVYNIGEEDNYDRMEALRAVVKDASKDKFAQLTINGTADERALISTKDNPNAVAYALIMANEIPDVTDLNLDIYTDEGIVKNIDLTQINGESSTDYVAITDSKVTKIAPSVSNTIKVQIDDNSFVVPQDMDIYNDEDLLQFIKWNARVAGARPCTATLMKPNVTLTKEMVDLLKASSNINLTIKANTNEVLEIAEDVPADILDYAKLEINSAIEIMGTVSLTKNSNVPYTVNVAEGAVLNINEDKVYLNTVNNYGTVNVAKDITVSRGTITNYAEMNIAEKADVKATVNNQEDATLNNSGYMSALNNNGEVILSSTAIVVGETNNQYGVIRTAKGAQVSVINNGEIVYVEGAVISATGTISYEATGVTIGKDYFGTTTVNKLILKKGITKISVDSSFDEVVAEEGASLEVADKVTLTVGTLTVEGSASTKGNIVADNVTVKKDATLTNNGTIKANYTFYNNGVVANNGKVTFAYTIGSNYDLGNWKYNQVEMETAPEAPDTSKQDTMDDAVELWAASWGRFLSGSNTAYYDANPYDVDVFITTMIAWNSTQEAKDLMTAWEINENTATAWQKALKSGNNAVSEFTTAVDAILDANVATLKKTIIATNNGGFENVTIDQVSTRFDTEAKAYDYLREALARQTSSMDAKVAAAAWKLSDSEIATALSKSTNHVPYAYIWKGCKLDEVMTVYRNGEGNWNATLQPTTTISPVEDMKTLIAWMNAVAVTTESSLFIEDAKTVVGKYLNEYKNWKYSDGQIGECGK